ncbi:MAG: type-F conjugative transfer system secretin TraK [Sulfurimonadaceae bacterium]|jgi:hypothetical protein|nr:type-F conjugative transfer system secretin TraK [Sulfurimonadaceae bacterium]
MNKIVALSLTASMLLLSALNAKDIDTEEQVNVKKIDYSLSLRYVDISKTDLNRIVCKDGRIDAVNYSKDKEIAIEQGKSDAFVRLLPVTTTSNGQVINTTVNEFVREVFVECNDKTYSLNLIPKSIPSQTIVLVDSTVKADKRVARSYENSTPYEELILGLTKSIYKGIEPDGYETQNLNEPSVEFEELKLTPLRKHIGGEYAVYEYEILPKADIEIEEKMFLKYIAKNPLAISATKLNLKANESQRLIVVANAEPDVMTYDKTSEIQVTKESQEDKK